MSQASQDSGAQVDRLDDVERWTLYVDDSRDGSIIAFKAGENVIRFAGVRMNEREVEVVPADLLRGAVEALREAITAARLFNRNGMTWREYDALLARLEHDHLGGQ